MDSPPPRRIPNFIKLIFGLVFLFLASLAILRSNSLHQPQPASQTPADKGVVEGEIFPDLELIDREGRKKPLSGFYGKVTIVSFWASWCAPCIVELPYFAKLEKSHGVQIVAVNQDDDPNAAEEIDRIWKKSGITTDTFFDPYHELAQKVRLEVLPTNYVLDQQGRLVFTVQGVYNWNGPEARQMIDDLLNKKSEKEI